MPIQNSILRGIIAAAGFFILSTGCKKDKYTTKPQLTFKSVNEYDINRGDLFEFRLEFTDKEGDVSDTLFIQNRNLDCGAGDYNPPLAYRIPDFPTTSNVKGELRIVFENGTNNTTNVPYTSNFCGRTDTTTFYFWMKDKDNNYSDTISTDKPLIFHLQ